MHKQSQLSLWLSYKLEKMGKSKNIEGADKTLKELEEGMYQSANVLQINKIIINGQ